MSINGHPNVRSSIIGSAESRAYDTNGSPSYRSKRDRSARPSNRGHITRRAGNAVVATRRGRVRTNAVPIPLQWS